MAKRVTKRFLVTGRVQGVGYRAFVSKHANALGIRGYAKNLASGDVEVLATGDAAALDALSGHLRRGPAWSDVRGVEEQEAAPSGDNEFFIA